MSLAAEWVFAALVSLALAAAHGLVVWAAWRTESAMRRIEDFIEGGDK